MNATKYGDVLETKLLPSARSLFGQDKWIFQDDNAVVIKQKMVKNRLNASP